MKSRIMAIGLVMVAVIGVAVIIGLQKRYNDTIVRKDAEISDLKDAVAALSVREADYQDRLTSDGDDGKRLQAQVTELENQLAKLKSGSSGPAARPGAEENKTADKPQPASDKMRRYARGILKVYGQDGDHKAVEKDQSLQVIFMEFMAEMMKLTTKYNVKINMYGGDSSDICKTYAIPEMRQWFCEVGAGLFEELNVPLSREQLKAIDELMAQTGRETVKIDALQLPLLEKTVMLHRLNIKQCDEFCRVLTPEQNDRATYDIVLVAMTGQDTCESLFSSDKVTTGKSIEECSAAIINNRWQRIFGLSEAEEQSVKYLADMYVAEYGTCKNSAEAEYGKEFMDYYLERFPGTGDYQKWQEARKQYFKNAGNRRRKDALDLRFAEIQLKHQECVCNTLPGGAERQKEHSRVLSHFPYLHTSQLKA